MSREQSFMSMVWLKSECTELWLRIRQHVERTINGKSSITFRCEFKKAFESEPTVQRAIVRVFDIEHDGALSHSRTQGGVGNRRTSADGRAIASFQLHLVQSRSRAGPPEILRQGPLVVSFFRGHW